MRLADFGLSVALLEKGEGRRQHTGESLPSSIRVVLDALEIALPAEVVVERPPEHLVFWGAMQGGGARPVESSLLVWRGAFDRFLRSRARDRGVDVIEGGVVACRRRAGGHEIRHGRGRLHCRFVVDASGRAGVVARRYRRRDRGLRTLALTAHFRTEEVSPPTIVEAVPDGWVWSSPLEGGLRDVTVMLDRRDDYDQALCDAAHVWRLVSGAGRVGRVRGIDATPYGASRYCDRDVLLAGDAGSFLDPLSAHGVHKAMDGALVGAAVVRTILERPERAADACEFFDAREADIVRVTSERLRRLYAQEARFADRPFWRKRSERVPESPLSLPRAPLRPEMRLAPASGARTLTAPVLEGDYIERREVLVTPSGERPVRYLGAVSLPELFRRAAEAPDAAAAARQAPMPFDEAYRAIDWLYRAGYLEEGV